MILRFWYTKKKGKKKVLRVTERKKNKRGIYLQPRKQEKFQRNVLRKKRKKKDNNKGSKNKKNTKYDVKIVERDVTILKDTKSFIEKVITARHLNDKEVITRVAMDGGGGSFKIVANVFDKNSDPKKEKKGNLDTGVKRILVLAHVQNLQERHFNLRKILEHLKLDLIPGFLVVGDLKILNILMGISSNSGKFSCLFCEGESTLSSGTLRTFENLDKHFKEFTDSGSGNF